MPRSRPPDERPSRGLPEPKRAQVIRYQYLWHHEARQGSEAGSKDRPCAIVVALTSPGGERQVVMVPITHSETGSDQGIEIPSGVKQSLGLDSARSWIVTDEVNAFDWPGVDLRRVPAKPSDFIYGELPPSLFDQVMRQLQANIRSGRAHATKRTR